MSPEIGQKDETLQKQLSATRDDLRAAQTRLEVLRICDGAPSQLIAAGLRVSYQRGRRAMERAYHKPEATAFHEWRKHVKDLGYQMQILRDLWPSVSKRVQGELDTLGDLLGKEHDLTVMRDAILKNAHGGVAQEDLQAFCILIGEVPAPKNADLGTMTPR